jgi:transposase-like protein
VRVLAQALMELEVSQHLGAERHERTAPRIVQCIGYRERQRDSGVGSIELRVDGYTTAAACRASSD